jgi:hypothetical protein
MRSDLDRYHALVGAPITRPQWRSAPFWLVVLAVPTTYVFAGLVALCIEGFRNVVGYDNGEAVTFAVLGVTPLVAWAGVYGKTRDRWPRRLCSALLATFVAFCVSLVCLFIRVTMNGPF